MSEENNLQESEDGSEFQLESGLRQVGSIKRKHLKVKSCNGWKAKHLRRRARK